MLDLNERINVNNTTTINGTNYIDRNYVECVEC